MDVNFKHIELFDKIIDGKASPKLRKAFELKRKKEPEFERAFQEHLMARKSISAEGRKILKADLAYLHSKMDRTDYQEYKPKKGSSAAKLIVKLLVVGGVVAGGYFAYKAGYLDKILDKFIKQEEVHHPEINEEPKEQSNEAAPIPDQKPIEQKTQTITYDTVYQIIQDTVITIDTVYEEQSEIGSGPKKRLMKEYEDSVNAIFLDEENGFTLKEIKYKDLKPPEEENVGDVNNY